MKKVTIVEQTNEQEWNKLVTHPLQSYEWGEARKAMGIKILRFQYDNKGYLMTLHPIPYTRYSIGYIPRSTIPTPEILKFLDDYGKQNNLIFVKIEPYDEYSKFDTANFASNLNLNILHSPHPLFPEWTQVLNLTKSEEELLKQMKSKTRYNIRLAQKKGVVIKEQNDLDGYKVFEKLYFDTCRRQKYYGHTAIYHETIWNYLKPTISHILIAYFNETPLCAYHLFMFENRLYYVYGGSSLEHKQVMAPNLLMWETIRLAKKLGAQELDMWGSLAPQYSLNDPWAGFTRFKEGYGCTFKQMAASKDLVVNTPLYYIYNVLFRLRSVFLKIRSFLK